MKKILLIKLNNVKYGIWKDEILSIKNTNKIHKIPLMNKSISIMCILEDNIVNLADLSSCLGGTLINNKGPFSVLVLSKTEKLIGFVGNEYLEEIELDNPDIIKFPDYFNHPIFHDCLLLKSEIIPILKVNELFNNILSSRIKPELFQIIFKNKGNGSILTKLKNFECNNEIFAVSSINLEEEIICPDLVCNLPLTPSYIKGITIYKEKVIPLIKLSDYLFMEKKQKEDGILIYNIKGQNYGFLISNDLKLKQKKEVICKENDLKQLPFLVQSNWLKQASIQTNEIIPIINFASVLSNVPSNTSHKQFLKKYKEGSLFKQKLFKEEIVVVEFSILGACHAIPDMEVSTIISFTEIKTLPIESSIVIGVTLFEDKIIPVIDLAICYGKKLELNDTSKMILIENGNFQAFVVTEKVFGKTKLSVNVQKELHLYIPKPILYGCYIKENKVNLIFNILVMALYFDTEVVQEIFSKLSVNIIESDLHKQKIEDISEEVEESALKIGDASEEVDEPALKKEDASEETEKQTLKKVVKSEKIEPIKEDSLMEEGLPVISNNYLNEENKNTEEPVVHNSIDLSAGHTDESSNKENTNKELPEIDENSETLSKIKNKSTILEEKDKKESTDIQESPQLQKKKHVQSEKGKQQTQQTGNYKRFVVLSVLFIVAVIIIALVVDIINLNLEDEPDFADTIDTIDTMVDNQNNEINNEAMEEVSNETINNELLKEALSENLSEISKEIQEKIETQFIENVNVVPDNEGITITLESIQFNPDSHEILPAELNELNKIVDILKNYPATNILIVGHTAYYGTTISLQELSERRAEAVRNYLLSFDIWKNEQITWKGMGPFQPISDNDTEEGRQRNRRVEIKILND